MWLFLIAGLIIGAGLIGLELWTRNQNIVVTWYDRLIGAIGLLLILFTIQNYFGSLAELEPTAANLFLLISGLPGVILAAVAAALIWRRRGAAAS